MARKGFFTFALGTAAAAAGVWLLREKGGLHVSFDLEPSKLGRSVTEWKAEREAAEAAAGQEGNGEAESE